MYYLIRVDSRELRYLKRYDSYNEAYKEMERDFKEEKEMDYCKDLSEDAYSFSYWNAWLGWDDESTDWFITEGNN